MINPLLESDRDRKTWAWIVEQVGEERARQVDLHGRKPFVSNIAKALGLVVPANATAVKAEAARANCAALLKTLGKKT